MQTDNGTTRIEELITALLADDPSHFLVEVRVKPVNNFKIFLDSDEGIPLAVLIKYNRRLYKMIEELGYYPEGDFSLELSSPGLDEPLKLLRQYKKNTGRHVEVLTTDSRKREGKLLEVTEDGIVLEIESGKGKKSMVQQETLLFSDIKTTKVQIKF